jgi:tripartite-type tricarboxylate transporter receptor subunit TctC
MPGAGSIIAANYVYGVAKPDGLTLGVFLPSLYFEQLLGRKEVQFDWAKYAWIGSPVRAERQMYMRADSPYKSVDDVRKAAEPPKCGATGTGSPEYFLPKLMEETLGAKFSIVTGYPGGQDIDLAVERAELHCRAFTIEAFFAREPFHTWHKTGFVRNLIQTPRKRDPRLSDTPTIYEHGSIQNRGRWPALSHRGPCGRRPGPSLCSEPRHSTGSRQNSARCFRQDNDRSRVLSRDKEEKIRAGASERRGCGSDRMKKLMAK